MPYYQSRLFFLPRPLVNIANTKTNENIHETNVVRNKIKYNSTYFFFALNPVPSSTFLFLPDCLTHGVDGFTSDDP